MATTTYQLKAASEVNCTVTHNGGGSFDVTPLNTGAVSFVYQMLCDGVVVDEATWSATSEVSEDIGVVDVQAGSAYIGSFPADSIVVGNAGPANYENPVTVTFDFTNIGSVPAPDTETLYPGATKTSDTVNGLIRTVVITPPVGGFEDVTDGATLGVILANEYSGITGDLVVTVTNPASDPNIANQSMTKTY